ncbi:MAG: hypothetical protein QOI17_1787, partial [Gaiellales bacterium]|nr:hypothetical protein [Gaiellales bacterium]
TLTAVPAVQHLFGLATAVLCYALLRKLGAGAVVASLCAAPLLLDGYLLDIEQNLLAESMFILLVMGGLALLVWRHRPSPLACAAAGGLLGAAALTRTVGMVLIVPVLLFVLLRWFGLVRIALVTLGFALPLVAYALWFGATWGHFGVTKHDGYFLYGRVSTFADCSAWRVPADQRFLCFGRPPSQRPNPNHYVWADWGAPRYKRHPFALDGKLRQFALEAIRHQPVAYASTILGDLAHYASPGHTTNIWDTPLIHWRFQTTGRTHNKGLTKRVVQKYGGTQSVNRTLAELLRGYQAVVFVQGPMLAAAVLAGLAAALVGRSAGHDRRLRAESLLFALVGVLMPATAAATTMFDYRYVLPAIPPLCLAAGTAVTVARSRLAERGTLQQPATAAAAEGQPLNV